MQPPSVSIVVCTRGRPVSLRRTLQGLALLRYPHELIIVHDPRDAQTAACIAGFAPFARTGDCASENLAQARNLGLVMAHGDIVAFIDDDAVPEPDWLDQIVTAYADPAVSAAGGFIRDGTGVAFQARIVLIDPFGKDVQRASPPAVLPPGWFIGLTGTNFSVRRRDALAIGGFDEQYTYFLEETDFLYRLHLAGGRIAVVPGAEVIHYREQNRIRNSAGTPLALRSISRSKAYYCHVNRQPGMPDAAIEIALRRFSFRKLQQIAGYFFSAKLNAGALRRLAAELDQGLREGEAAVLAGRRLLTVKFADADADNRCKPPPARDRLCVFLDGEPENDPLWPHLQALAATHEVTILAAVPGWRRNVRFTGGLWVHRLPLAWRIAQGGSARAFQQELNRIGPRRSFTHILAGKAFRHIAVSAGLAPFAPL
jgi:GT2 family glycosyltransferase